MADTSPSSERRSRRTSPLVAPTPAATGPDDLAGDVDTTSVTTSHGALPSVLLAVGVAVGVGVAAVAIAFSIIAVPLYALASTEPGSGLDRALVRRGLFGVAVPLGVIVGVVVGVLVGTWYGRGGRLPGDRTALYE